MIIFTSNPYGVISILQGRNIKLYNLTSYINEIPILKNLIPSMSNIGFDGLETEKYNQIYANFVMNNIDSFGELMLIMDHVYNHDGDVIIAINNTDEYSCMINENTSNLIERRYGYPCYYIENPEDLFYINQHPTFSSHGIMNMDVDINRLELQIPLNEQDMKYVLENT